MRAFRGEKDSLPSSAPACLTCLCGGVWHHATQHLNPISYGVLTDNLIELSTY